MVGVTVEVMSAVPVTPLSAVAVWVGVDVALDLPVNVAVNVGVAV